MVSRSCDVIELQLFSIDHLKVGKVVSRCFVPTIHPCTMFVTKLDQDLISGVHMYCIDVICSPKKVFFYITDADLIMGSHGDFFCALAPNAIFPTSKVPTKLKIYKHFYSMLK